jgi:hypothetical protein
MSIFFKKILLGCIVMVTMRGSVLAQIKFSAEISPSKIHKEEYATLRLVIENATDIHNITPPSFKDFIVVSGPNQETGMSNVNGLVKQYMGISYILQPRHTGKIIINAASATINGKSYTSRPLKLQVLSTSGARSQPAASASPFAAMDPYLAAAPKEDFNDFILKKEERVQDKVSKNMLLKLQTNKTSCYVGEPVVASYKLYTRLKSESKLTKNPSFNGFSVIDLQQPDVTDYAREKLNGREYNVYTIRKAQLYPLQDGTIELESATLENNVQFLKEDAKGLQDNLDGFMNGFNLGEDALITETVSLTSKPVSIKVKPLPEAGKPVSFNGAVGKFDFTASLEKNSFTTDETGKLTLVVSGAGNLQLITAPEINWPAQLEPFESKVTDELLQTDVPVSGRKIIEIPFTVQLPGNYNIPSIEFSFFDPATASYKRVATNPIAFTILKGTNKPLSISGINEKKAPVSFAKKMFENRGWIVAVIGFIMALGLLGWIKQERKKNLKPSLPVVLPIKEENAAITRLAEMAAAAPQNPLSLSETCLNSIDCREFYTLLNQDLKTFFAQKFLIPLREINVKKILAAMDMAGIDNKVALQVQQLFQDVEWQLYTPFERNDLMDQLYSRAQSTLQLIQTYHPAATL